MTTTCETCLRGEKMTPSELIQCQLKRQPQFPGDCCSKWVGYDSYGRIFMVKTGEKDETQIK